MFLLYHIFFHGTFRIAQFTTFEQQSLLYHVFPLTSIVGNYILTSCIYILKIHIFLIHINQILKSESTNLNYMQDQIYSTQIIMNLIRFSTCMLDHKDKFLQKFHPLSMFFIQFWLTIYKLQSMIMKI